MLIEEILIFKFYIRTPIDKNKIDSEDLFIADKAIAFKDSDLDVEAVVQGNFANIRFFARYVVGTTKINLKKFFPFFD